jgi:hypothetical protein
MKKIYDYTFLNLSQKVSGRSDLPSVRDLASKFPSDPILTEIFWIMQKFNPKHKCILNFGNFANQRRSSNLRPKKITAFSSYRPHDTFFFLPTLSLSTHHFSNQRASNYSKVKKKHHFYGKMKNDLRRKTFDFNRI